MSGLPAGALPLDEEQTSSLQSAVAVVHEDGKNLTVLYGSQTGNGEEIASQLVSRARAGGFPVTAVSLADFKPANLKRESLVTFVISTHGEGEPPDDAELFHEFLLSKKAPELSHLQFCVLALGDSSYVNFCQTGREFDARLAQLGAERLAAMVECDLDYEADATDWVDQLVSRLPNLLEARENIAIPALRAVGTVSTFNKSNPFPAEILVNQKITGGGSSKDVRHIELSLEGSGLSYEPGDSLAVIARNPPQLVVELLDELALDGDTSVSVGDQDLRLTDALTSELEITVISRGFLRDWAALSGNEELASMLQASEPKGLGLFFENHQVIDVVRLYPTEVGAQDFVGMLRNLSPRSYSISSSPDANPDEVHLSVAAVRYEAFGHEHWGAASTYLADRLEEGDTVSVYVERNARFRLPREDVPIIMIGPGTGIAPFRAFVEQRAEQGSAGDNWLFFGDRNFDSDFLYQLEWQRYLKRGNLTRLDVAFSRDQRQKIYVQDRIRENSKEVFRWLERGAALYVCGDSKRMAGDVNDALIDVLVNEGGMDAAAAAEKLKALRGQGRYQRDVY